MIEKILEQYIPERFISDARYRRGHIRVINPLPGTRVLGLHIPDMRKAAAELTSSADRAVELIRQFEAAPKRSLYYEEYMVWGMMLNRMKMPLEERLDRLRAFVPHIPGGPARVTARHGHSSWSTSPRTGSLRCVTA